MIGDGGLQNLREHLKPIPAPAPEKLQVPPNKDGGDAAK